MNHGILVQSVPACSIAGGSIHPSQRRTSSPFARLPGVIAAWASANPGRLAPVPENLVRQQ